MPDVKAFLRTWYSPANATLILVGPFDEGGARALVKRYFESLPSVAPPARPALPAWTIGNVVASVTAKVIHKQVVVAWKTPPLYEPGDRELDIVARVLAGPDGMLVRDLVDQGLATSVAARQLSARFGSIFVVNAQVPDGRSVAPIRDGIDRAIAELAKGTHATEIAHARKAWADRVMLLLETSLGRATRLAVTTDLDDPWDLHSYDKIDAEQVASAIGRCLTPERRESIVIYPPTKELPLSPDRPIVVDNRQKRLR